VFKFSEKVLQGRAELRREGGDVIGIEAMWEGKKLTLKMLPGRRLANETAYIITLARVRDTAGNPLEGGTIKFTTKGLE
jgi:hypothetical protein